MLQMKKSVKLAVLQFFLIKSSYIKNQITFSVKENKIYEQPTPLTRHRKK